ncbi:YceI family protein [Turneriella parva]|uniref:YceI family protein n=1 Tax=Turneriella parva (strain ATCC BAA-1111 / DSM 21527 / NCTC 11395 / H) TaxID=869212 RepID=I4B3G0_TURPD|nr:YceI family protein [Turneriella parva]AFM11817.1 YceI family protein [Turneriella parva DSM 21527]
MKKSMTVAALAAAAMLFTACEKPPVAQAAPATPVFTPAKPDGKEFKIDVAASKIEWIGTKVTGKHNGTINLKSGSVFVKDGAVVAGKFTADMASLDDKDLSGEYHDKLNKHLKSDEFFDVEKFPEGVFEISSVEKSANGSTVKGNLTLKGVTHGVTFDADIVTEKNAPKAAKATFNIDRKKWGIVYPGKPDDLISDTINLTLDLKIKK